MVSETQMLTIDSLFPDQYGIELVVGVVENVVTVTIPHESFTLRVAEYLVGDATGCIHLKTSHGTPLVPGQCIRLREAYTQVIDGSMRLVTDTITTEATVPPPDIDRTRCMSHIPFVQQ